MAAHAARQAVTSATQADASGTDHAGSAAVSGPGGDRGPQVSDRHLRRRLAGLLLPRRPEAAGQDRSSHEDLMVTLLLAARTAASAPLLPDLNAKLQPSNSTPWTILFVLTLITLLPAI